MKPVPHAGLVPGREPSPARHTGAEAEFLGQVLPLDAGVQDKQDPAQSLPVRNPWPPRHQLRALLGQQRLDERPQFVRHDPRTGVPLPHGQLNEQASRQSHHLRLLLGPLSHRCIKPGSRRVLSVPVPPRRLLEAPPSRVAGALALADAASDVRPRGRVQPHPDQRDRVHCSVPLTVAAAVEPVLVGQAGGGRDRGDTGERGEGGLGAEPARVRPADQDLSCGDRTDAQSFQ